jgi:hypothetical protein
MIKVRTKSSIYTNLLIDAHIPDDMIVRGLHQRMAEEIFERKYTSVKENELKWGITEYEVECTIIPPDGSFWSQS